MIIQSKFKDYYDYISHQYGADPNIIYERKPLKVTEIPWKHPEYFQSTLKRELWDHFNLEYVVAGQTVHIVLDTWTSWGGLHTKVLMGPSYEHLLQKDWKRRDRGEYPKLPSGKVLDDLIRQVGAPVFTVARNDYFASTLLGDKIPVLADLGFPALIAPGQMWQNIYTTFVNVLRKNPDKEPPMKTGNDDRIEAAGFDLKTSFRNPINAKPKKRK